MNSCNYSPEGHHKNQRLLLYSLPFAPREKLKDEREGVSLYSFMSFLSKYSPEAGSRNSSQLKVPDFLPVAALKAKLRILSHTIEMNITA